MFEEKVIIKENNVVSAENAERNLECPIIKFNDYEIICNYNNDSSRRIGILSGELYKEIINDPNTEFINLNDHQIPAFINIKYGIAMGYDAAKCEEYVKDISSNVRILALPIQDIDDNCKAQIADIIASKKCALYFCDHNNNTSDILGDILDKSGIIHTEKPLIDPRTAKGDEQAALFLYSCCAEQTLNRGERKRLSLVDVQDYYDKNVGPLYTPDGKTVTTLILGGVLSSDKAEEMWLTYDNKFDFLGKGHPISMQDSKEDFFRLLRQNNTMVAATYGIENGIEKLICFTYFNDNMESLYWLNQRFLNSESTLPNTADYVTNLFTPGLVSTGMSRSYAHLPIGLFAKVGDEAGLSANVMYENTNLSKRYVPKIVDATMRSACVHTVLKPSQIVDKINYRLWSIGSEDE